MQETKERKEKKASPLPIETRALEAARSVASELRAENELDTWKTLFRLARRLWALEGVCEESYDLMLPAVVMFVEELYGDEIADPDDFAENDDLWLTFVDAWFKVRYPEGQGPLEVAFRKSESEPVRVEPTFRNKNYVRFISMCYHLQQDRGDQPILLPVERVGALFGKDKMQGSRLIRLALRMGLLQPVAEANRGARRARTFFFNLSGSRRPSVDVEDENAA